MKSKILSLLSLSILALVMVAGMASADVLYDPTELIGSADSGTTATIGFNMENTFSGDLGDITFDFTNLEFGSYSIVSTALSVPEITETTEIEGGEDLDVTLNIVIPSEQEAGVYEGSVEVFGAIDTGNSDISRGTLNITLTVTEPVAGSEPSDITDCSALSGVSGDLDIKIKDINIMSGFGDDEDFWYPLDEIEVEIEVENNGDEDMDDIAVEWGLYNVDKNDWIIDDEESDFNLKDGQDDTMYITFKLEDVDDFENDDEYVLYVWANAEIDDDENTPICASDYQNIEITNDDDFVILDDITYPTTATCGSEVQITADVWNVGDSDQDEVKVVIFNSELGINKIVEIGDINDFDNEILDTFVEIPSDVEEKTYAISLKVFDEDSDVYETDENNDESKFIIRITLEGCSVSSPALVSANLVSGGKAGENLVVKSTIVNSGTKSATYTINAAGYAEWANSYSVDQTTFTIDVGASKEVLFTFDVNEDASGEKQFNIEVISGNEVTTQTVQIEIEGKSSGFAGITGNVFADSNKYLWGIGILNVVLIIFIIIVAVKVAKK